MSNAPSKPVSFSRPKVGYFSNRPRIYEYARNLFDLQHNSSTSEFTSYFYKNSCEHIPIIKSWRLALHKCIVIFLIYLLRAYTVDVQHIYFCFLKFLELVFLITIFTIALYRNSYF